MIDWKDEYAHAAVSGGVDPNGPQTPMVGATKRENGKDFAFMERRDGTCTTREWFEVKFNKFYGWYEPLDKDGMPVIGCKPSHVSFVVSDEVKKIEFTVEKVSVNASQRSIATSVVASQSIGRSSRPAVAPKDYNCLDHSLQLDIDAALSDANRRALYKYCVEDTMAQAKFMADMVDPLKGTAAEIGDYRLRTIKDRVTTEKLDGARYDPSIWKIPGGAL